MPITTNVIQTVVDHYLADHPDRAEDLAPLTRLLAAGADVTSRREWAGHVTVSAIVERAGRFLVVAHRKYGGILIQPGGHLEPGDRTLYGAALRELAEETGLRDVRPLSTTPLHVAVYDIPAFPDAGEDAHLHFDFRFAFTTTAEADTPNDDEVAGVSWLAPQDIANQSLRAVVDLFQKAAADHPAFRAARADAEEDVHRGPGIPVGVYLILRDERGRILIGLRSDKVGISPDMWALPCGSRERGESAVAAVAREAGEELGITVDLGDLEYVHTGDVSNSYGETMAMYFTTDRWQGSVTNAEPDLCRELMWVDPTEPLPMPFVQHVEIVLSKVAAPTQAPYTSIGWPHPAPPSPAVRR